MYVIDLGGSVNKAELVNAVAAKVNYSPEEIEKIIDAFSESITDQLKSGNKVALAGFGSFLLSRHRAFAGTNPRTREKIQIPATTVVHFRPGEELKNLLL